MLLYANIATFASNIYVLAVPSMFTFLSQFKRGDPS